MSIVPKPYPKEFRDDVVRVARSREPGVGLEQIAKDFGIHFTTLYDVAAAGRRRGRRTPGTTQRASAELREAEAADPAAGAGERGAAPRRGVSVAGQPAGKMLYPLVSELAADGIPVAVTCRVLKLARQPYYRWLADPVTDAELVEAHRANALFDAHRDDPEFGYRFLADEAREAGQPMAERTAWRICCRQRLVERVRQEARQERQEARPAGPRRPVRRGRREGPDPARFTADGRISCGSATSPSTGPARASSTSARSRTCSPTGSSATPSTPG